MTVQLDKPGESSRSGLHPKSIPLYLINGVATVWDPQTAATLHCTHSISGLRTGTLPGVSQQNGFLGLPLTLMQEETAFLVRSGVAYLVPVHTTPTAPSREEVRQHTRARVERIRAAEEDVRREEEVKEQRGREKFEMGGEAARSKREARARIKAEKAKAVGQAENMFVQEEQPPPASPCPESTPTSLGHFHEVPSYPLSPSLNLGPPITSLPHPLFPFPATPRDRALVQTFTTLNSLNLRMGLGPRFGGEYLIYPGDYLRYHAHFTSQVLVRDQCIRPGEIVAWGRLGTGTKKAGLICCWDDGVREGTALEEEEREGEVDFYSLEWANFG